MAEEQHDIRNGHHQLNGGRVERQARLAVQGVEIPIVRQDRTVIVVRVEQKDGRAYVSVLDRGPGIAPEQAERMKEPFTRRDASRMRVARSSLLQERSIRRNC